MIKSSISKIIKQKLIKKAITPNPMGGCLENKIMDALVAHQRKEIETRYTAENIAELGYGISEEDVEFIKMSVLDTLYPDIGIRETRMDDFDSLRAMANPVKLVETVVAFPKDISAMIITYRSRLLKLALVGKAAANLNNSSQSIDKSVVDFVVENYRRVHSNGKPFRFNDDSYREAYTSVRLEEREKFVSDAAKLVKRFKDKTVLRDAGLLLEEFTELLKKRPEQYEKQFRATVFIQGFVERTAPFFIDRTNEEMDAYVDIIKRIETNYNAAIYNCCRKMHNQ